MAWKPCLILDDKPFDLKTSLHGELLIFELETWDRVRIRVSSERLEEARAHGLVYAISPRGRLTAGIGAGLLARTGPQLADALNSELARAGRSPGTVVSTRAFQLQDVWWIWHLVALTGANGRCESPDRVWAALGGVLDQAENRGMSLVAMAAIGSGGGGLPAATVARGMVKAVRDYFEEHPASRLTVTFCLPNGVEREAFERALGR